MLRLAFLAVPALLSVCAAPATAAVRHCAPPVASDVVEAATETEARRLALADWLTKIAPLGDGYKSWRLAAVKRLPCLRTKTKTFKCAAFAAPCTIRQMPQTPNPHEPQPLPSVQPGRTTKIDA